MSDRVRIVPFNVRLNDTLFAMYYKVQVKVIWFRIGPIKFYKWNTTGEYATIDSAVLDAKTAMMCINGEWEKWNYDQR